MKKWIYVCLFMISTTMMAGWRWQEISMTNEPQMHYYWKIGYNPEINLFILTTIDESKHLITWGFDGHSWSHLSTYDGIPDQGYNFIGWQGSMTWNSDDGIFYDFETLSGSPIAPPITAILKFNTTTYSWDYVDLCNDGVFSESIFDKSHHKIIAQLYISSGEAPTPTYDCMLDYDGTTCNTTFCVSNDTGYLGGRIAYDEGLGKTIFRGDVETIDYYLLCNPCIWDGESFTDISAPMPKKIQQMQCPMIYSPELMGTIIFCPPFGTLIYRNYEWSFLNHNEEGMEMLAYNTYLVSSDRVYLFQKDENNHLHAYILTSVRTHERPFNHSD